MKTRTGFCFLFSFSGKCVSSGLSVIFVCSSGHSENKKHSDVFLSPTVILEDCISKYIFDFIILARSRDIFLHHHLRNNLLSRSEKACQNLIMTF